jgi:tether containing UBX domain for GLUT4
LLTFDRYKNKNVDLSVTYRLAGLPSGAQLDLVQSSRSPSVVNIALQLPQTENNARVTEKFPSTTSLWQILRRFEAGVAGGTSNQFNLTQRGIAQTAEGGTGAGRLFYEMPTLQVMNRELGTFGDLQKTLAQLGITSGSALLRLSFKNSGRPLEEAMKEITEYFKQAQSSELSAALAADAAAAEASKSVPASEIPPETTVVESEPASEPTEPMSDILPTTTGQTSLDTTTPAPPISSDAAADPIEPSSSSTPARNIAVFSAPSTTVPQAATMPHNESDYLPTIDHAKLHQSRLTDLGKNRRLPSDAEIAATQKAKVDKLSTVEKVRVRVRLPDQTQVQDVFGRAETSADVWGFVRLVLRYPEEEFVLKYLDAKGRHTPLSSDSTKKLIQDLGWTGDTLIYLTWGDNVSVHAKKEPSLNDQYMGKAEELKVSLPRPEPEQEEKKGGFLGNMLGNKGKDMSPGDKEARLKKFMGFGKKK